jgi:hypothetical protein
MERFRRAVEAKDVTAMVACLAEGIVFQSPLVFHPYIGREAVGTVLRAAAAVFEDFRYVAELSGSGQTALVFHARVGSREVQGIDLGQVDANGLLTHLTVFVRPLSAALALGEAMRVRLGRANV